MKQIHLIDVEYQNLLPLTYTRPVSEIRIGITTIFDKWKDALQSNVHYITAIHLQDKYPSNYGDDNLYINSSLLPTPDLIALIDQLADNSQLIKDQQIIAFRCPQQILYDSSLPSLTIHHTDIDLTYIKYPWHIFQCNEKAIQQDIEQATISRSKEINASNTMIGNTDDLYVDPSVDMSAVTLNTKTGPIYIGKNCTIMEGSMLRGPLAICEGAVVKMGTKIYGATTIGPYSKVGGELSNVVIQGFSNKGHDGYLGNAVLGQWCNLGADTNASNLKNNYSNTRVWNYSKRSFLDTQTQFCGLIMGDHSKTGINTMFNTATVVGVSCNIYGGDFPRKFIPSFTWGSSKNFQIHQFKKSIATAKAVMQRRNIALTEQDEAILAAVFDLSASYRTNK